MVSIYILYLPKNIDWPRFVEVKFCGQESFEDACDILVREAFEISDTIGRHVEWVVENHAAEIKHYE